MFSHLHQMGGKGGGGRERRCFPDACALKIARWNIVADIQTGFGVYGGHSWANYFRTLQAHVGAVINTLYG